MGTQLPLPKGAQPPIFGPYVLRQNGCMDQDATWYGAGPWLRRLCVRWVPSPPPPQFSTHFYCGQMAGCIKIPLGMDVGLCPGDFILDGDPVPLPKKDVPKFSAHVYCGQTAGWIKMPRGMKVGLSPGDSVRWRPSPHPHKGGGAPSPIFGPFLLWPNGMDASRCYLVWRSASAQGT